MKESMDEGVNEEGRIRVRKLERESERMIKREKENETERD